MQRAQIDLEQMLRLQILEENSLRGFILTHDNFYSQQYAQASSLWAAKETDVRDALTKERLFAALGLLGQYDVVQNDWRREIAQPLFLHGGANIVSVDKKNKEFTDYQAMTAAGVEAAIAKTSALLLHSTQEQIDRSSYARTFWLLIFGLLAIFYNAYGSRLTRQLQEERTVTDALQQAFFSRFVPLPRCEVGATYLAASSRLRVGGDVYDVFRLSPNDALVMIADVSGKGVDAAVLTAFVRFTVRSIALRHVREPGKILDEFNEAFRQSVEDPSLFVTMLVGILNCSTASFIYASAGHDSAYVRRSSNVEALPVTGPLLGVMDATYGCNTVQLEQGDTIVLATDGLTEARTRSGALLGEEGATRWIGEAPASAQPLADTLSARARHRSGNRPRDDLALLVVRYTGDEA